jgi:hypothetical protein
MDPLVGKSQALDFALYGSLQIATAFQKRRMVMRPGSEPLSAC